MTVQKIPDLPISEDALNRFGEQLYKGAYSAAAPDCFYDVWPLKENMAEMFNVEPMEFDAYLEALVHLCAAEGSYFHIELQRDATKLKALGYSKRTREKQCFVDGLPVYGLKIRVLDSENVYTGYAPVKWDEVQNGEEVYIDNYQHGLYPKANPRISGPYQVISRVNRYLKFLANGRSFTFHPEELLKREEAAG